MILDTSILLNDDEGLIRERISAYFVKLGYTLKRSDTALIFQRGSPLGTWLALSPLEWKVEAMVEFLRESPATTEVSLITIIDTAGRLVTQAERRFWKSEMAGAERALQSGEINCGECLKLANDAINQNLLSYLLLALITVVFGFIGLFIIGSLAAAIFLLVPGLVAWWLILRHWQNK
jgi:hypothetical protein